MSTNSRKYMLLGKVSYIISAALMIAALVSNLLPPPLAQAAQGAIWSTTNGCGSPSQDVNEFSTGDHVYINGSNFDPGSYDWTITGKPGGASGDPDIIVAPNPLAQFIVDSSGAFCYDAYTVAPDDWGEYQIKFGNKGDNYSVNQVTPPNPSLSLTKTDDLNPAKFDHVGQVVTYTLAATNTGNVTLHSVTVSDNPSLTGFNCTPSTPVATLDPGASVVCTGTHSISQGDLDAGSFADTASATSTEATAPNASDAVSAAQNAQLGLTKTDYINPGKFYYVGQIVDYVLEATNTGNITLHNVTLSDNPALENFRCGSSIPLPNLAPGGSVVCRGTHTITWADMEAGSITDTASASSDEATAPNADDTIYAIWFFAFDVTKTDDLNPTKYDHVGQVVTYTITDTNTGNLTLHDVMVGDNPALDGFSCNPSVPVANLDPGASVVCTGTHPINQADLDAGSFTDSGYATCSNGCNRLVQDTVYANQNPKLSLTKTDDLNPAKYDHVGQAVSYTLTATNSGNVTLHNVSVSDNPSLDSYSCNSTIPVASLAPGTSVVCTGTHTITQADMDAGTFADTASATSAEASAPDAPDTILGTQSTKLSLTKTDDLNPAIYDHVGQAITYTLTATNVSNVTLHNVTVSDNPALDNFSCTPSIPVVSLAPGASVICTGTHTISQEDLDVGSFADIASASSNEAPAPDAPDTILGTQGAKLSLTKIDDLNPAKYDHVGQVVTYTLTATNSGNVTLHNVGVSDNPALSGFGCTPSTPATLAVGASIECKGSHTITQADLDAGSFADTASASSTEISATDAQDTVNGTQDAVLSLTKSDDLNPAKYDQVGDVVTYTLTATNSGNVTLHNVSVSDSPALAGFECLPSIPAASLAPGSSIICTGTHSITQADLDAGKFPDTASATSTEVNAPDAPDTVLGIQNAFLSLTKTATEANFDAAGVTLHYTLVATNTGNVTLTGVTITDVKLGTLTCSPLQPATLDPGAKLSCTGTYLTTQADVDAGKVDNVANAGGLFGTTPVLADPANASVPALGAAHLSLTKVVTESSFSGEGVELHYTLVATNDSAKTLTGVTITDVKLGTLDCDPAQPATLAPAEKLTCTGIYVTTQDDVDAGKVDNIANASGTFDGDPVSALPASATVPGLMNPHLSLTKVATEPNFDAAGVTLHYTLVATNDGNVTLTAVSITDPKLGTLTCVPVQPATLAPEATLSCTGIYVTTQDDLNAGRVNNTSNAGGMYGLVPVNAAPASAVVPAHVNPPVPGCTDPSALNYNPNATVNDGSCIYGGGGGEAILIPVTGVDTGVLGRTLPGSLLGLSFGFAGLGLVFSGLARRRED